MAAIIYLSPNTPKRRNHLATYPPAFLEPDGYRFLQILLFIDNFG
jgi:hypothetical protein